MSNPMMSLARAWADGTISAEQMAELERLMKSDPGARELLLSELNIHSALDDLALGAAGPSAAMSALIREDGADDTAVQPSLTTRVGSRRLKFMSVTWGALAIAALLFVALAGMGMWSNAETSPRIARIAGLGGSLMWTGDGGRIIKDLAVDTELSGGTIEGMVPDSWFELEFNDGSTVTISGNSMLTFSDYGQKELHLRKGTFSANVVPQPAGLPMLVHTRSARLEVLGTQFEVEAGLSSTLLNVSEGKVRVKRLSDGNTVDVPSRHRVVASADHDMLPARLPDASHQWKSQLNLGPTGSYGRWQSATDERETVLKAIPYTSKEGITVNAAGFRVSTGDAAPVVLQPDSYMKVRGKITDAHEIYFGVTAFQTTGEFVGRYQTGLPADQFEVGQEFTVLLPVSDFLLDPTSIPERRSRTERWSNADSERFPKQPFGLAVRAVWLHSLFAPAGLEVTEIELIPGDSLPDESIL